MTSIKIKLRPSNIKSNEGHLYYQIIHHRQVRQIKTSYRIFSIEWDEYLSKVRFSAAEASRKIELMRLQMNLRQDTHKLKQIIYYLEEKGKPFITDDVVTLFHKLSNGDSLFGFMQYIIAQLHDLGKVRTSETYATTLKSFMRFRKGEDIDLSFINSDLMMDYEAYLKRDGISMNTISFYMRILRATYNRAVEKELTIQRHPFKHVYTGIDKTIKRALPLKSIKKIKEINLSTMPSADYARDMFLFSFYTRGMSFIDMAFLKKKDLSNGIISYRRKKTGQPLYIKWEKCMQQIIDKYPCTDSPYLLPIIKHPYEDERKQYKNAIFLVNCHLKKIAELLDLSDHLTMYVARHSWASIAKSKNIPISVISESMGHDSEATTEIYLASLDTSIVDKANQLILKSL